MNKIKKFIKDHRNEINIVSGVGGMIVSAVLLKKLLGKDTEVSVNKLQNLSGDKPYNSVSRILLNTEEVVDYVLKNEDGHGYAIFKDIDSYEVVEDLK